MKIPVMGLILMLISVDIIRHYSQFQDLDFLILIWLIFSMVSSKVDGSKF